MLANASHSSSFLARQFNTKVSQGTTGDDLQTYASKLVKEGLGIQDATDAEIKSLVDNPPLSVSTFADMISRRAQIGWSTHGHSAVDVNIYGTAGSDTLRGNHENTEIGEFLRNYLAVDVKDVTKELLERSKTLGVVMGGQKGWTGRVPSIEDLDAVSNHWEKRYGPIS